MPAIPQPNMAQMKARLPTPSAPKHLFLPIFPQTQQTARPFQLLMLNAWVRVSVHSLVPQSKIQSAAKPFKPTCRIHLLNSYPSLSLIQSPQSWSSASPLDFCISLGVRLPTQPDGQSILQGTARGASLNFILILSPTPAPTLNSSEASHMP